MLQEKQKTLNQVGLCKDRFKDVEIKKQSTSFVAENVNLNDSGRLEDIRSYFTPKKKIKLDNTNRSFNITANTSSDDIDDIFDDGLNDLLCDLDF